RTATVERVDHSAGPLRASRQQAYTAGDIELFELSAARVSTAAPRPGRGDVGPDRLCNVPAYRAGVPRHASSSPAELQAWRGVSPSREIANPVAGHRLI